MAGAPLVKIFTWPHHGTVNPGLDILKILVSLLERDTTVNHLIWGNPQELSNMYLLALSNLFNDELTLALQLLGLTVL